METKSKYFILVVISCCSIRAYDDIDMTANTGVMLKFLRDMANQTQADTLNLPANATSIRENITDTFSCENRTYGYYADVDNDCQIFHVCLPSQGPTGRNVTYRWSFICPAETVFNQEVLVCTRPIDAIDCADSPDYYFVNMELGKIAEPTDTEQKIAEELVTEKVKAKETKIQKRKDQRRQNIIVDNLLKEIVSGDLTEKLQEMAFGDKNYEEIVQEIPVAVDMNENEPKEVDDNKVEEVREVEDRIASERRFRTDRQLGRGSFRFKADV